MSGRLRDLRSHPPATLEVTVRDEPTRPETRPRELIAGIRSRAPSLPSAWDWIVLAALLVVAALVLFHETRGTTFTADEWTWIFTRRGDGLATFLDPHNGHFSLVPVLAYKLLFATAGMRDYWPYRAVVIGAHLLCVVLVFTYARPRVGGYFALFAAALILFFGPGWQNFMWPFQMAWLFAIASGIGALKMLDRGDRAGDVGAAILLGVSVASAGPGLAFAAGLVVEVLLRRHWRDWWIFVAPLALYAMWWVLYQQATVSHDAYLFVTRFVYSAAAGVLSALVGLAQYNVVTGSGAFLSWGPPLLILALAGLTWRLRRLGYIPVRLITLLTIAVSFWVITGIARSYVVVGTLTLTSTGNDSRYLYVGAVVLVLAIVELARGTSPPVAVRLVVGLAVAYAINANVGDLRVAGTWLRGGSQLTVAYLGSLDIARPIVKPNFVSAGFVFHTLTAARYFDAEKALGSPGASASQIAAMPDVLRSDADAQLIAIHGVMLTSAASHTSIVGAPPRIDAVASGEASVHGSCVAFRPRAPAAATSPSVLALTVPPGGLLLSARGGSAAIGLRRFASQFQPLGRLASSSSAILRIAPDLASQRWHVQLEPAGRATACGL